MRPAHLPVFAAHFALQAVPSASPAPPIVERKVRHCRCYFLQFRCSGKGETAGSRSFIWVGRIMVPALNPDNWLTSAVSTNGRALSRVLAEGDNNEIRALD
jgi:hypothetical protein